MIDRETYRVPASRVAPMPIVLAVVFFASLGTGVFWNALSFVAKHGYGFTTERNLVLAMAMGGVYAVGAFGAGALVRRLPLSPRTLLVVLVLMQAGLCALPVLWPAELALWLTAGGVSLASALQWPIVESYVTAGRHGKAMRGAIGAFNLTWMTAVCVPLFAMAPILETSAVWAVGAQAIACLICVVPLAWFPRHPAPHDTEVARTHVGTEYGALLRSARMLLLMSYVLVAAMTPLLPYRFEAIGAPVVLETPATATWMIVRIIAMVTMWNLGFWHGRWGTLLFGGVTMSIGFAVIVLAPTIPVILSGFAALGIGVGVVYYAALYYAMAVGAAAVEAGGTHEGLIGLGYGVGPAAALIGSALGGGGAIVATLWALLALGGVGAAREYSRTRRK